MFLEDWTDLFKGSKSAEELYMSEDKAIFHYAGFWIRVVAHIIDNFVLLALILLFILIWGSLSTVEMKPLLDEQKERALGILFSMAYHTLFLGAYGATPGKMLCRIKVVCADGSPISDRRALGRFFAYFLSYVLLCLGFIVIGFDKQKRGLHDSICRTRVVYRGVKRGLVC